MNRYGDVEKYRNFFKVCERVNDHPDDIYRVVALEYPSDPSKLSVTIMQ